MFPQAREEKLLVQEVGDELVVYDQKRHRAHRLNATAARIWRRCDGRTGVAELAATLEEAGLPTKEDLVWLALDRLEKADLLREPVVRPEGAREISRRKVLQRLGLAGLAFLLPAVTSITAPVPAMAQYGGGGGGGECFGPCCLCRAAGVPPAPTLTCTRAQNGNTTETSVAGKCFLPRGGTGGNCQGQACKQIRTWECTDNDADGNDTGVFEWKPGTLTDDCQN